MPAGADTVFMQEDVTVDGDAVVVPKGLKRGANRRLAGEDVAAGAVALAAGTVLEPQHIALAAALGLTELDGAAAAARRDLLDRRRGGRARRAAAARAAIYDANRYLLRELLERLGARVTDLGILADDPAPLAQALRAGRGARTISSSPPAAFRPAKPITCAMRSSRSAGWCSGASPSSRAGRWRSASSAREGGDSAAFVGLPGNPVAVFVTFVRVVKVLLRRLSGARPQALVPLPVRAALPTRRKRTAANMCASRCGAAPMANSKRSSIRRTAPAFSRR